LLAAAEGLCEQGEAPVLLAEPMHDDDKVLPLQERLADSWSPGAATSATPTRAGGDGLPGVLVGLDGDPDGLEVLVELAGGSLGWGVQLPEQVGRAGVAELLAGRGAAR
jgi:hypothetical protein